MLDLVPVGSLRWLTLCAVLVRWWWKGLRIRRVIQDSESIGVLGDT